MYIDLDAKFFSENRAQFWRRGEAFPKRESGGGSGSSRQEAVGSGQRESGLEVRRPRIDGFPAGESYAATAGAFSASRSMGETQPKVSGIRTELSNISM